MKQRFLSILLAACMVLALLPAVAPPAVAAADGSGITGSGTEGSPYIITTADQLAYVAQQVNANGKINSGTVNAAAAYYKLGSNIDLAAYSNWTPIGNNSYHFNGAFDGAGHIISNLKISTTNVGAYGLFGEIELGTVKNVGLSGVNINVTSTGNFLRVGGLAGNTDGTILNCFVAGNISGTTGAGHTDIRFGGLVGRNAFGTVENCYTTAAVSVGGTGTYSAGGLAGYNQSGSISYSYWLSSATSNGIGSSGNNASETGTCSFTGTNSLATTVTVGGTNTSSLLDALNAWLNNEKRTDLYTWVSSGSYPVFGPLWTPPTYTVSGTVHNVSTMVGAPGLTVKLYASTDIGFNTPVGSAITNESGRYTISGVSTGSYRARVAGVLGSYAASVSDTITVSNGDVTGPTTDMALVALTTQSIAVTSSSHKTAYRVGEPLDVTNLKITVTRSDGSTYDQSVTTEMVGGFNASAAVASQTLTITFDGKMATYVISVSRAAYSGGSVNAPSAKSKTDTQVVLHTVIFESAVEYGVNTSSTPPSDPAAWQADTTFTGLTANTDYYFFARVKQTETVEAGGVSDARPVTTKRSSGSTATPAAPTIGTDANKPTSTSITIATVAGNEYYISTSNTPPASWLIGDAYFKANSNGTHKFYIGLSPATKYYIHVRVAETETAMPSASASVMQYTLPATPSVGVGYSIDYETEKISVNGGYEVNTASDFTGTAVASNATLTANTTYYVRKAASGEVPASAYVSFDIPARSQTPTAITTENITKTHNTITIASTVSTQEYSVDGTNWTLGNNGSLTFEGLTEAATYNIVTRVPASASAFASLNSDPLSVTTKTAPASPPTSGVSYSVKDGIITGLGSTYEYSLNGGETWQTASTGVTFDVGNVIRVRTRETTTAMPSQPQTLGTVPALEATPAYAIDYAGEKTTASVSATVEYNTSAAAATTWTAGEGATLALIPDTTYYFRVAATDTALAGNVQTLNVPARPDAPADTTATIAAGDDASHTAITLANTYEYILADEPPAASASGTAGTGSAAEVAATSGQHVYIRQKAVANTSLASDWVNCGEVSLGVDSITLTGVDFDVAAGKLIGTTANMEYQIADGDWTICTDPDTSDIVFAAGAVKVRQKDKPAHEYTVGTIAPEESSDELTLGGKTYNSVTLAAVPGYEYSKDNGVTWQDSNSFSGLSGSTEYSFVARIKATATTLPGTISTALTVTTDSAPSPGGASAPTGAPVIVDGKTQNIGTEEKSGDTTTVTVDQAKLGENIGGAANGSSVVVPVSENGAATASLVVKNIADMAQKGMTLTVQTGSVAYNLNTSVIDTAALEAAFPGADMSKVPFDVTIQSSSVSVEGETLVLSPVAFTVTATYNGKTVSVDTFSAFIDRVIEVTKEQAAKITTAVVVNADGSVRHVPTNVIEKGGKYYAVVSSRTNSTYALIQNEVTFADAKGKWYEAAVNEMGSRKIITGRSASVFDGEASITRAEFAAILIRALGLPADGTSTFSDVPADAWYTGAIATAVQYGLVTGKSESRFDPNANISRQEAMLMLQRAAALTEFSGISGSLDGFSDADSLSAWALDAARWCVGSGLIQGADGKLNPTAGITRAESAAIILRLLQKAGLVDVRR